MKLFNLEKWYFDFVTPDHIFVFCYFAAFDLANIGVARFNLSIAHESDKTNISSPQMLKIKKMETNGAQKIITTDHGTVSIGQQECELNLTFPHLSVNLLYQTGIHIQLQPLVIARNRSHKISWSPLMMPARVSGRVAVNNYEMEVSGFNGYIDYLHSNVFPLQTPVRFLYWGRFSSPACTLTYTVAQGKTRQWTRLIINTVDGILTMTDLSLEVTEEAVSIESGLRYPKVYRLQGTKNGERATITVTNFQGAIEANFFGSEAGLSRRFYEYISRNPKGIKFFARADITLERSGSRFEFRNVAGIAEYLVFRI